MSIKEWLYYCKDQAMAFAILFCKISHISPNIRRSFDLRTQNKRLKGLYYVHVSTFVTIVKVSAYKERGVSQSYDWSPFINRTFKVIQWQHKSATKHFGSTTIAFRLWTVSWYKTQLSSCYAPKIFADTTSNSITLCDHLPLF